MRGTVFEYGGEQWMRADVIKQEDAEDFVPTLAPHASFMPFEYGDGEYRLLPEVRGDSSSLPEEGGAPKTAP